MFFPNHVPQPCYIIALSYSDQCCGAGPFSIGSGCGTRSGIRLLVKKWHLQLLYMSKNNPEVPVIMFSLDLPNITKEKKKDSKKEYFFYVFTQLEWSRSRLQKFRLRLTQNAVTDRLRLRNTDSNHIDFTQ